MLMLITSGVAEIILPLDDLNTSYVNVNLKSVKDAKEAIQKFKYILC